MLRDDTNVKLEITSMDQHFLKVWHFKVYLSFHMEP